MDERPNIVSICCAVYNHEPYLRDCLNGFVKQNTNFRFEAIIHDDASTDESASIIREYAEKYPNIIKPIYQTVNQYSLKNGGIKKAMYSAMSPECKYIAICEGDDYWTDSFKLQKQYDAMKAHPECSICTHITQVINKDGSKTNRFIPNTHFTGAVVEPSEFIHRQLGNGEWAAHTTSFFYRRDVYDELVLNPPRFRKEASIGDLPHILFSMTKGKLYFINEVMSCYRTMSGGFNSNLKVNKDRQIKYLENSIHFISLFDEYTNGLYHVDVMRFIKRFRCKVQWAKGNFIKAFIISPQQVYAEVMPKIRHCGKQTLLAIISKK